MKKELIWIDPKVELPTVSSDRSDWVLIIYNDRENMTTAQLYKEFGEKWFEGVSGRSIDIENVNFWAYIPLPY